MYIEQGRQRKELFKGDGCSESNPIVVGLLGLFCSQSLQEERSAWSSLRSWTVLV